VSEVPRGVDHLVVRAPNWVGDLVMATPVLAAAAADERFGRVTVVLRSHLAGVLAGSALEASVRPLERGADETRELRGLAADAVLLLSNSLGAAWRARRAAIPLRAGAALGPRRWLLTHAVVPPTVGGRRTPVPTAHLLRDVAGLLGVRVPSLHPVLAFGERAAAGARALLTAAGLEPGAPYVVCAPGAAFGAAKLWPPASFARVADELWERRGWRTVVVGGPGEGPLADAVVAAASSPVAAVLSESERAPAGSASGEASGGVPALDLELLKPLVAGARLVVVGDSGPRWYAAAFDVPCVSVMGPNFPELTASSLERCEVVRLEGLECSPCLRRRCPLDHHRCLRGIEPAQVLAAAERVVAGAEPEPGGPRAGRA